MRQINIHDAKTHLSRLVEDAAAGEEIVIAKAGRPVARLVKLEEMPRERKFGRFDGRIRIGEDFDDPLPEDIGRALGIE